MLSECLKVSLLQGKAFSDEYAGGGLFSCTFHFAYPSLNEDWQQILQFLEYSSGNDFFQFGLGL